MENDQSPKDYYFTVEGEFRFNFIATGAISEEDAIRQLRSRYRKLLNELESTGIYDIRPNYSIEPDSCSRGNRRCYIRKIN